MKENIIQAIVAKMQRDLDCRQMGQLKAILASELQNVEIVEKKECANQQAQENEHILNSFISDKKIEGCSDKTLAYYCNTIERLLSTLSLAICHITTTDIRTYLSNYQEEHQSSKVTIDNMRRTRLTISGVDVRIRKLGQALSIPKVHPHKFRRTLATIAIDKGMPIEQVQRLLGHVRIDTTLQYAIVNQNNVKMAHKKYLG